MKLKLVICSKDQEYVKHLVNYLTIHYYETVELFIFDREETLDDYLNNNKADILLLDDENPYKTEYSPIIAYLTEYTDSEKKELCIFKYQKGELIYKTILNACALGTDKVFGNRKKDDNIATIHLFLPLNGGAGSSTVSKAYALRLSNNKRVLYLNLEIFGNCEKILHAGGDFSLDDILYSLKSRRGSLALKLESALKKSQEGIQFYAPSANPINLLELTGEEFKHLLSEIRGSSLFDEIVLDMDSFPSVWMMEGLKEADDIWLVADGTGASNEKYGKFNEFIIALEKKNQVRLRPKMKLFYNKYSSRMGKPIEDCDIETVGGSSRYEGMEEKDIIKNIAMSEVFNKEVF